MVQTCFNRWSSLIQGIYIKENDMSDWKFLVNLKNVLPVFNLGTIETNTFIFLLREVNNSFQFFQEQPGGMKGYDENCV